MNLLHVMTHTERNRCLSQIGQLYVECHCYGWEAGEYREEMEELERFEKEENEARPPEDATP